MSKIIERAIDLVIVDAEEKKVESVKLFKKILKNQDIDTIASHIYDLYVESELSLLMVECYIEELNYLYEFIDKIESENEKLKEDIQLLDPKVNKPHSHHDLVTPLFHAYCGPNCNSRHMEPDEMLGRKFYPTPIPMNTVIETLEKAKENPTT